MELTHTTDDSLSAVGILKEMGKELKWDWRSPRDQVRAFTKSCGTAYYTYSLYTEGWILLLESVKGFSEVTASIALLQRSEGKGNHRCWNVHRCLCNKLGKYQQLNDYMTNDYDGD